MEHNNNRAISLRRHVARGLIAWTVIVFSLLGWELYLHLYANPRELAEIEARVYYKRDLTFRLWSTSHGGVYVPVDKKTPPSPDLAHVPERDIVTPSGRQLTLMNPAYIMRQVYEEFSEVYGMRGRLTSLKPLREENAPDPWEKKALLALEQGREEVKEYVDFDGALSLRMMQPMATQKGCLKCHGHQGYKEGDVRGGVSISLPLAPFVEREKRQAVPALLSYGTLWLLGLAGIWLSTRGLQNRIRERDLAEQQLQEYRDNLENLVAERTTELNAAYAALKNTQSQMLQREKMASIGQLAAGVAHEINNPVGFITSNLISLKKYVERLSSYIESQAQEVREEASPRLAEIRRSLKIDHILADGVALINESIEGTERIKTIVQSLKTFSRLDEAATKPTDINTCIDSTLNIVWNELKYKCEVKKEYGELPQTVCNPQQLNQVFMNLLINAAQAIETKGEIGIKTWADQDFIYARISDTGSGIPQDTIKRIFEPFYTSKEVGKGTGLGLSIVYDIVVKNHHGDIQVESEVGTGTSFTVKIPVIAAPPPGQ